MKELPETKRELKKLRDEFAISIINGYLSNSESLFHSDGILVNRAYKIADLMIEVRNE